VVLAACESGGGFITGTRSAQYVVESGAPGTGSGKKFRDYREFSHAPKFESNMHDPIHDRSDAALPSLQEPREAMAAFPIDRRGGIDWVKALDLGIINPRSDLQGNEPMATLDQDILFKDTGNMPWVKFPHIVHTKWLACENCHPEIFIPKAGANNPSMDGILAGEFCGRCHDKVAFALWICERCHSVPHKNSPKKWW
jgi:c(7)-type cytochrome triheme protein